MDLVFIALTVAFFASCGALVCVFERLRGRP